MSHPNERANPPRYGLQASRGLPHLPPIKLPGEAMDEQYSLYSSQRRSSFDSEAGFSPSLGEPVSSSPVTPATAQGSPTLSKPSSSGKTFQCTGFPGCSMSFSRSEHLARHVRKHTGEKPFTCRCGKKFTRLDNLRQHATTIHADEPEANEELFLRLAAHMPRSGARAARKQANVAAKSMKSDLETSSPYSRPSGPSVLQSSSGSSQRPAPPVHHDFNASSTSASFYSGPDLSSYPSPHPYSAPHLNQALPPPSHYQGHGGGHSFRPYPGNELSSPLSVSTAHRQPGVRTSACAIASVPAQVAFAQSSNPFSLSATSTSALPLAIPAAAHPISRDRDGKFFDDIQRKRNRSEQEWSSPAALSSSLSSTITGRVSTVPARRFSGASASYDFSARAAAPSSSSSSHVVSGSGASWSPTTTTGLFDPARIAPQRRSSGFSSVSSPSQGGSPKPILPSLSSLIAGSPALSLAVSPAVPRRHKISPPISPTMTLDRSLLVAVELAITTPPEEAIDAFEYQPAQRSASVCSSTSSVGSMVYSSSISSLIPSPEDRFLERWAHQDVKCIRAY